MRRLLLQLALPLIGALAGGLGASVLSGKASYQGEAVFVVPAGSATDAVGQASEAWRLAQTLSRLIPNDTAIVNGLANAIGADPDAVRDDLSAVAEPETALLHVRYTNSSEQQVTKALTYVVSALSATPVTPAIAPNSLIITRQGEVDRSAGSGPLTTGVGVVAGFVAGLFVVTVLRRLRPVVSRSPVPAEHELLASLPRTDVQLSDVGRLAGLQARWSETFDDDDDDDVLVLVLCDGSQLHIEDLEPLRTGAAGRPTVIAHAHTLSTGTFPGRQRHGVVVTSLGAPLASAVRAADLSRDFGCEPIWLLVLHAPTPGRR